MTKRKTHKSHRRTRYRTKSRKNRRQHGGHPTPPTRLSAEEKQRIMVGHPTLPPRLSAEEKQRIMVGHPTLPPRLSVEEKQRIMALGHPQVPARLSDEKIKQIMKNLPQPKRQHQQHLFSQPFKNSRTSTDIKTLQQNNTEKCNKTGQTEISKCDSLLAFPSERKECKENSKLVINGITGLTNKYSDDMNNIIHDCGDKTMTQEELQKCEKKLAEISQEYVAQCMNFANVIETNYGKKTFQGRKDTVKSYMQKIVDILPGQKSKREKAELEQGMKTTIKSWIEKCERNQSLTKATGMERYPFECKDIKSKKSDNELEPFVNILMNGVNK
jgi:hypothetical protein